MGSWMTTENGNRYAAFHAIKYAKDPIGNLRFKPPEPFNAGEALWDVSENPHIGCFQYGTNGGVGQEDCLILNVYVPESAINNEELLPVMTWIHGGALKTGASFYENYGPQMYMDREIVLVTINYRLGVFGFLSLGDEVVPGNAGFRDQSLALKWVNQNIKSFFGDPEMVTIFGESAGGDSVSYQIISPKSRGLFRRAIMQSGTVMSNWARPWKPDVSEFMRSKILEAVGCLSENALSCLMEKSAEELAEATHDITINPVVDKSFTSDPFVPSDANEILANGEFDTDLEIMIGTNKEDGMLMVLAPLRDSTLWQDWRNVWNTLGPATLLSIDDAEFITEEDTAKTQKIVEFYLGSVDNLNKEHEQQIMDMYTDATFLHGAYRTIKYFLDFNVPTYHYILTYAGQYSYSEFTNAGKHGVCHADDLLYLFNPVFGSAHDVTLTNEDEIKLREEMTSAWTNFAKYGDPTPPNANSNWNSWTPLDKSSPLSFWNISGVNSAMSYEPKIIDRMEFWDSLNLQ